MTRALLALALACVAAACDVRDALPPDPAAATRAADDDHAERLRAHLAALPAVAGASVVIDRSPPDPLARAPIALPPSVAVAVVARGGADPARIDAAARAAGRALLGDDARLAVSVVPAPGGPALARLGPFTVAAAARGPLLALIAGALAVIAALAAALTVVLSRRRAA